MLPSRWQGGLSVSLPTRFVPVFYSMARGPWRTCKAAPAAHPCVVVVCRRGFLNQGPFPAANLLGRERWRPANVYRCTAGAGMGLPGCGASLAGHALFRAPAMMIRMDPVHTDGPCVPLSG